MTKINLKYKIIYDGQCQFCLNSVKQLKFMDLFKRCEYLDYHQIEDLTLLHPGLTKELAASQLHLIAPDGQLYGGFFAFRQMCWLMPLLYPFLIIIYIPFVDRLGLKMYRWIATNRLKFHSNTACKNNGCMKR